MHPINGRPETTTRRGHQHGEAFCLMKYRADDGSEEELIWNSRDGVTPFVVTLRSGKQATHVDWPQDQYLPDYQPPIGSRMFVDLDEETARANATANVRRWADDPEFAAYLPQLGDTEEQQIAKLTATYLMHAGAPALVEVTDNNTPKGQQA